jgi:signal transduction histidine kinase/ligand-binding sensor domain-containing protein
LAPATSQQAYFSAYTTAHGLPNDNVTCIKQDREGFLWVGTSNGLCRFDGTHFYTFPSGIFESNHIAGDLILDLEEEGDYMWATHRFGATRIHKQSFVCKNYQSPEKGNKYLLNRAIRDVCKDAKGNLWFAGSSQLMMYDPKLDSLLEVVRPDIQLARSVSQISKIVSDGSSNIFLLLVDAWVAFDINARKLDTVLTNRIAARYLKGESVRLRSYWNTFPANHFLRYEPQTGYLVLDTDPLKDGVSQVRNFFVDNNLNVFINSEINDFQTWTRNGVLRHGLVSDLFSDETYTQEFNCGGIIDTLLSWGSPRGLLLPDKSRGYTRKYFFSESAMAQFKRQEDIMNVREYNAATWLVATRKGLYMMDKLSGHLTFYPQWKDSVIYDVLVMPNGSVWLSTDTHLVQFHPFSGTISRRIYTQSYCMAIIAEKDKIIAATRISGMVIIDTASDNIRYLKFENRPRQLVGNKITSVKKLNGNTFIVTYNDSVGFYSYNNFFSDRFIPMAVPADALVFRENFVIATTLSVNRQAWFGHYIGGITVYDSVSGTWSSLSTQNGLSSNSINQLLDDKQSRVWIVSEQGIDIYDIRKKVFSRFPLAMQTGGRTGGFVSSTGRLVFFDKSGFVEIDPSRINTTRGKEKIIFSQALQGPGQLNITGNKLFLPYRRKSFSIVFSLLKFEPGRITGYAYRLKESGNWTEIGTETKLSFASLQPGKYNLQIRATDEFGQWSHYSDTLTIVIKPPFWNTWWFYILTGFTIGGLLWMIYRYRIRQLKRILAMRAKISQDLHDEVGATLSGVTLMSELANDKLKAPKVEEAQKIIERITSESKEMAEKMNDIVWAINPVNDSMVKVLNKIQSFGNNLCSSRNIHFHFNRPEGIEEVSLNMQVRNNIYLISKEAINNAVKYSEAKNIHFTLSGKKNNYMLKISDDGKGFDTGLWHSGNGISNMKTRAAEIKGQMKIYSEKEKGTVIELYF